MPVIVFFCILASVMYVYFFPSRHTCTVSQVNTFDTSAQSNTRCPILYLLTLLMYQGGLTGLKNILFDPWLQWMLPKLFKGVEVKNRKTDCNCRAHKLRIIFLFCLGQETT